MFIPAAKQDDFKSDLGHKKLQIDKYLMFWGGGLFALLAFFILCYVVLYNIKMLKNGQRSGVVVSTGAPGSIPGS